MSVLSNSFGFAVPNVLPPRFPPDELNPRSAPQRNPSPPLCGLFGVVAEPCRGSAIRCGAQGALGGRNWPLLTASIARKAECCLNAESVR